MKKTLYLLIAITCFFASCKKDETSCTTFTSTVADGSLLVLNEGQFGKGNAKVTLYNPATSTPTQDLFNAANCRATGDVLQSMLIYNGKGYIVVNNSAKIEVVDINTFKSLGTINIPGSSPRCILPIGGSKAYVSDLYAGKLNIIDLDAYTASGSVTIKGETEQMEFVNNKAYVLNIVNMDSSYVQEVDPTTNTVTSSTFLSLRGATGMVKDNANKLWVLCSKYDTTNTFPSGLVKVNPSTNTVETTLSYPIGTSGFNALSIAPNGTTLCFLDYSGAYKMTTSDIAAPTTAFISAGTHSFYGIGIDKTSQKIYIGDAVDYKSNGKVYIYNLADGTAVGNFDAGISPGHFYFK